MKYTTIFFDLDDTLIDTAQSGKEGLKDIYKQYKLENYFPLFDEFYNRYQKINLNLWDLYEHGKIDKQELKTERFQKTLEGYINLTAQQALNLNEEFMQLVSSKKNNIEGAIEILEYLQPKYRLHILSNGFKEIQDYKIEKAGMSSYFTHVVLSDHIGKNKPHPLIFEHALLKANTDSASSIMIGDNIKTDITGAKNSKMDQVWFNPHGKEDIEDIHPTYQIKKLEELRNIL